MTTRSLSHKNSSGLVLLPVLIIILTCALILLSTTYTLYAHLLLTKEANTELQCQKLFPGLIKETEHDLSLNLDPTKIPMPEDQNILLNKLQDWPLVHSTPFLIHSYSQLIASDKHSQHYVSLIALGDQESNQRVIYTLLSLCTLAEQRCHPLQWSTL